MGSEFDLHKKYWVNGWKFHCSLNKSWVLDSNAIPHKKVMDN